MSPTSAVDPAIAETARKKPSISASTTANAAKRQHEVARRGLPAVDETQVVNHPHLVTRLAIRLQVEYRYLHRSGRKLQNAMRRAVFAQRHLQGMEAGMRSVWTTIVPSGLQI